MNAKYYLDKFLRIGSSYAAACNASSLFSSIGTEVIESPAHPNASEVTKWRIVKVNNVYALCGRVWHNWHEFPVNGKCWTWHEFAIAKDRDVLRVWKDLNGM